MSTEPELTTPSDSEKPGAGGHVRSLARWKKVVLALSVVAFAVGLGLNAFGGRGGESAGGAQSGAGPRSDAADFGARGLTSGPTGSGWGDVLGGEEAAVETEESPWGPFLMKGGLSFFLAFCVGYALRTFLKMTVLVIGVVALAILGLQQAGIVDVDWAIAQSGWDSVTAHVSKQFESLKTFLAGSLPSAGMGGLGLLSGFKS